MRRRHFCQGLAWWAAGLAGCQNLENAILYQPTPYRNEPLAPADSAVKEIDLLSADGTHIHARWCQRDRGQGALIFCHGNVGNLFQRAGAVAPLMDALNVSVLIFDYPGYGRSSGKPSEQGCCAAADAVYNWLTQTQGMPAEQIIIFGESLGGGIALDLASRKPHRALILAKTFTSIPDMAENKIGLASARSLVSNRYDNLDKIGSCHQPVFMAHGTRDEVIPIAQGRRLFAAANDPKQFHVMEGIGHNDPLPPQFYAALQGFLNRAEARTDRKVPGSATN